MLISGCHIISRTIANIDGSIANDLSFDLGRRTSLTYYYHVSFVTRFSTMPCPGRTKEVEAWFRAIHQTSPTPIE
jgi:hypothetical protein